MATNRIDALRNTETGEIGPVHVLGVDELMRPIYQRVDGWEPVGLAGKDDGFGLRDEYEPTQGVSCDADGNWFVDDYPDSGDDEEA